MPGTTRWLAAATAAATVTLALAAGCYRGSAAPEPSEPARSLTRESEPPPRRARPAPRAQPERSLMAQALEKLTDLTDELCACTDQACANAVLQDFNRWTTEHAAELREQKPTDEESQEATAIAERLSKCMMTAMGGGSSSPPSPP